MTECDKFTESLFISANSSLENVDILAGRNMFRVNQNGQPNESRSISTPASHRLPKNLWTMVKARRPDVIEYGRKEGILDRRRLNKVFSFSNIERIMCNHIINLKGTILLSSQNADKSSTDGIPDIKHEKIILQLGSSTEQFIEAAIPFLPVPCALVCLISNILIPGLGNFVRTTF